MTPRENRRWAQSANTAVAITMTMIIALTQSSCASADSSTPAPTAQAAALPPIRSVGDKALGRAAGRNISLAEVIAEIGRVDAAGAWKLNKQWEIIINSLQTSEIPGLLDVVEKMRSDAPRTALRHAFFSRWAETDPAAAMDRALKFTDESLRKSARATVIQGWAYTNPTEVAAWARQLPEGPLKFEVNAAAAVARSGNSQPVTIVFSGSGNSTDFPNHFAEAAAVDVKAAIAEAARIPNSFGRVQAYNAIAKIWAAQAPADAMKWALTLPDGNEQGNERTTVGASIAMQWARQNPRDANEFLAAVPEAANRPSWMGDTFKLWGERDFDSALAWAQKIPDTEQRRRLLNFVLDPWLKRAPQAAADFVLSLPADHYPFVSGTEKIVALWSANNPRAMEDFLRRMTPEQRRSQAFLFALSNWLQAAPEQALQVALDSFSGSQRIDFASRALTQLAKQDVDAAKRKIGGIPDDAERPQILRNVLANIASERSFFPGASIPKANIPFAFWLAVKLAPTSTSAEAVMNVAPGLARLDVDEALTWAKSLPAGPAKNAALQHVVRQLNESDPGKALNEVTAWPPGQTRSDMLAEIASRLAQKDPRRAVQLVVEIEDLALRASAVRGVVQIMSRSDPAAAIPAVMSLPVSETRAALVADVVQQWAQSDAAGAAKWAAAQTTSALRAVAFGAVVAGLSTYSVAEAAALLEKIPPGERLDRAVGIVCEAWCRSDPASAARWAAALPSGSMRALALPRVVVPFARVDYISAGAWLENLPPGLDRDRSIQGFLSMASAERAAELTTWVAKISDLEIRLGAIETIARLWLRADPNAANAWLANTDLPVERRNRLRASPPDYYR